MRRVLLLGGYGGFGARIALRIVASGWEVLVAGRSQAKAQRFCRGRAGLIPIQLDRDRDLTAALAEHRPFAVVDAAGPFQGASYAVPHACIAAGCHYLDIADARDFVVGIKALDADARSAEVTIISGGSSVSGLSGAVVRSLAEGLEDVRAVEIAISASNRAAAGPSVTRAIFSYIGKPIPLWRGRRWGTGYGWQEMRRQTFAVGGAPPLTRLVALADVPDLSLLPERLPGKPAVSFRAGTELSLHNRALWLLSWPVRWGWLANLVPLAPLVLRIQHWTAGFGSDRSAMIVRLFGIAAGERVERRWTLMAEEGDGPEIPGLAVPILLGRLAAGTLLPGARDAGALLGLEEFEPAFRQLAIKHETVDVPQPHSLYRRVMGPAFAELPPAVQAMHGVLRDHGAHGRGRVVRGRHLLARLIGAIFGFPPAGEHHLHVWFQESDGIETWTRDFGGHRFRSRLSERDGRLVERFGPFRFGFELRGTAEGLSMHIRRWWMGPLPMPLALAPRSIAREWQEGDRFHFNVPIALPLVGLLIRYQGWLSDGA